MLQLGLHRTHLAPVAARLFNEFVVLRRVINMSSRSVGSRAGGNSVNSCNNFTANERYDNEFPPLSANKIYGQRKRRVDLTTFSNQKSEGVKNIDTLQLEAPKLGTCSEQKKLEVVHNIDSLQCEASTSISDHYDTDLPTSFGKKKPLSSSRNQRTCSKQKSKVDDHNIGPLQCEASTSISDQYDTDLPTSFGKKKPLSSSRNQKLHRTHQEHPGPKIRSKLSSITPIDEPFDICPRDTTESTSPGSPRNRGMRVWKGQSAKENEQDKGDTEKGNITLDVVEESGPLLRSGMVLFKHYITLSEQVEIVNRCRDLGCGPGGFYRPGYNGGAKLRLYMMCLGLDWNPQTQSYGERRHHDKAKPPDLPPEFTSLVCRVIDDSHALIERDMKVGNVEDVLPRMYPDTCIVNFYTTNGRLGLHQDRDESRESLDEELPVVSISIGDSAEFLYGDQRDVNKAESVILESGDVLVFGGASRHIYHGVSSIIPDSAPPDLLESTGLRPGRLNLTFRQN